MNDGETYCISLVILVKFVNCISNLHINWMAPGKNRVTAISTKIFKYVRIHPNFMSRPVWCEKMFLCCFSLKAGTIDLTNRPKVLSLHHPTTPPPPPPPQFLLSSWKMLNLDTRDMRNPVLHGKKQSGGGWGERTLGLFVKSFLPAFREKQHRNIFSHHTGRLVKFGWILKYLKISVQMTVTRFLPGTIQFCRLRQLDALAQFFYFCILDTTLHSIPRHMLPRDLRSRCVC